MSKNSNLTEDDIGRMVMLVYGQMGNNAGPFWCYLAVKPSRYDDFQAKIKNKKFDIRTFDADGFGEIIVSGEGVTPPADVTKKVAFMFKVPIKELFLNIDAKAAVAKELERVKNKKD